MKLNLIKVLCIFYLFTGVIGCQVVIPRRGDFYELDQLKLAGDLGQILYHVSRADLVFKTLLTITISNVTSSV